MAKQVAVMFVDDISGGKADETVRFGLDGAEYEIDLNRANAKALEEALAPYVDAARKMTRARPGRLARPLRRVATDVEPAAVRAWARANGWDVPNRGRIAAEVVADYKAAGN